MKDEGRIATSSSFLQPSTFNLQPSTFNLHPSSFNLHPSSFNLHPSSFILHPSSLNPFGGKAEFGVGPHLYLLGIDLTSYRSLRKTISELGDQQKRLTKLQSSLEDGKTKKVADIPAILNKEKKESEKIDAALGQLKADPAFEAVEGDLVAIERQLASFHDRIMGNSEASFRFEISDSKTTNNPISFDCRILDDGSYSINRDRTLLYDFSLLFDPVASVNHPGYLLHDNILEVDQDTVYQTLNFLAEQIAAGEDFQYILTLNRDKISEAESLGEISLDIESAKVASFTKEKQFLRQRYSEK